MSTDTVETATSSDNIRGWEDIEPSDETTNSGSDRDQDASRDNGQQR